MTSSTRGKRTALLSLFLALATTLLVALAFRRDIIEWLTPSSDPRRASVALRFEWDPNGLVRCETRPYLRQDETWLEVHEFPTDPGVKAAPDGRVRTPSSRSIPGTGYSYGVPDLREIEDYLEFRKRDRTPLFGEPGRLAVLISYGRDVPWELVDSTADVCRKLGITELDVDGDD